MQVGMVKKTKRLAFKAAFKYGCIFGAVRDVNRCTVVVPGLVGVQAAEHVANFPFWAVRSMHKGTGFARNSRPPLYGRSGFSVQVVRGLGVRPPVVRPSRPGECV